MHYPTLSEAIGELRSQKYANHDSPECLADIERLRNGEPLQYVMGYANFLGCHIDMSTKPMIPRYETAYWVEKAAKRIAGDERALRLADLFAGSGNIGIALLKLLPAATMEFHEIDATLFPGIERSLMINNIDRARAQLIVADGLSGLAGKYDALFAVPPYIPFSALPDLDPEQRDHEPHLAFFAEENGRAYHRLLIEKARQFLVPGGHLFMETDMDHKEGTDAMLRGTSWSTVLYTPDPYGALTNVILTA